jgi:signal transduction histidine kinase
MNGPVKEGMLDSTDADTAALLRSIARDVAHELRSPVQSIVVNLEVIRYRIRGGAVDEAIERSSIIEQETLRMHRLADAFLALLRPADGGSVAIAVDRIVSDIEPILAVLARNARVRLDRSPASPSLLARLAAEPATLALLRIVQGSIVQAGVDGAVSLAIEADAHHIVTRIVATPADSAAFDGDTAAREALDAAARWLHDAGGTASIDSGSDQHHIRVAVRFRRAA